MTTPSPIPTKRARNGWFVGLTTLAVVAIPAVFTAMAAVASFTGCFLGCSQAEPAQGVLWVAACVILLTTPIAAGLVAAGIQSSKGWFRLGGVALALMVVWHVSQRVI